VQAGAEGSAPVSAIEAISVGRDYPGATALQDVSFAVDNGRLAVLMGPSGSGKSTLLRILGVMDSPTRGEVRVGGRSLGSLSSTQRAAVRLREVATVFQAFNLIGAFTLRENIELPLLLAGEAAAARVERITSLAQRLGIGDVLDRFPGAVSAGQRQRAAAARALAPRPSVLLLDEPTASLDTANALQFAALVDQIVAQGDTAVIMATHDERVVPQSARILRLVDGRLADD